MLFFVMDRPKLTPKDFFLYLGAVAGLYWSAGSLIALLFAIVDASIPDNLQYFVDPYSGGIRFAIASLAVIFPLTLTLLTLVKRDALLHPEKFLLPLRRWLLSLTIFVTSLALLIDVIALINSFLGGEMTARFSLKALAVLVVAGVIFWYCLTELRLSADLPRGVRKAFLFGASLLVVSSIVSGFFVMGSPGTIRKMRFDEARVADLQNIQWQVVNFWQQKSRLPKTLAELEDPVSGYRNPTDPETRQPYEFKFGEGKEFSLCAFFALQNAAHSAGHFCVTHTIDAELYPPKPRP